MGCLPVSHGKASFAAANLILVKSPQVVKRSSGEKENERLTNTNFDVTML